MQAENLYAAVNGDLSDEELSDLTPTREKRQESRFCASLGREPVRPATERQYDDEPRR
jgi:hypothetical protein